MLSDAQSIAYLRSLGVWQASNRQCYASFTASVKIECGSVAKDKSSVPLIGTARPSGIAGNLPGTHAKWTVVEKTARYRSEAL